MNGSKGAPALEFGHHLETRQFTWEVRRRVDFRFCENYSGLTKSIFMCAASSLKFGINGALNSLENGRGLMGTLRKKVMDRFVFGLENRVRRLFIQFAPTHLCLSWRLVSLRLAMRGA